MPELPEVESTRRELDRYLTGATIQSVRVDDPLCLERGDAAEFCHLLSGRRITAVQRRGKYLIILLDPPATLVIHLRMTGSLLTAPPGEQKTRLTLNTDSGPVVFCDVRRLGKVWAAEGYELPEGVRKLGPEPFDEDLRGTVLLERVLRRRVPVKAVLLDQRVLAGLGNIYADEALWLARIHPLEPASSLTESQWDDLLESVRQVLSRALEAGGTTFSDYRSPKGLPGRFSTQLEAYQRQGQPCSRCGAPIERTVVAGRGTHYCPRCQRVQT